MLECNNLKLAFASREVNRIIQPKCLLCIEVFDHSSVKEAALCQHLESMHVKYIKNNFQIFKEKETLVKLHLIYQFTYKYCSL